MRIAQITDIHAAPDNGNMERLHRVMSWIATIKPDLLVVTGDLIDDEWSEGYGAIEKALQLAECRYLILPGNSDDKEAMRHSLQEVMHWPCEAALHFSERVNGIPVIGVDTTVAGETHGDITRHLPWLRKNLENFSQPALLFMHHHLFSCGIAPLDAVMCHGAEAFSELITYSRFPPLAICSGHVHRTMFSMIADVPSAICGSVCSANPLLLDKQIMPPVNDPPALMIHDVREGVLVSSHVSV